MRFKKALLEGICEACRNVHPSEFLAMLGVKEDLEFVEELVVVPAEFGKSFSAYRLDLQPLDSKIVGTVHSHPSANALPSRADLRVFSRGKVNLIVGFPYVLNSIRAFDSSGKEFALEIVE